MCPLFIHQEYLFENSRIDNIFTDQYYETFTSALHEVVNDFKLPVNELGYFVTRSVKECTGSSRNVPHKFCEGGPGRPDWLYIECTKLVGSR